MSVDTGNDEKGNKQTDEPSQEALSLEDIMKQNEKKKAELAKKRAEANKTILKSYRIK